MHVVHVIRATALALTLGACATAGVFPSAGDPTSTIPNAERLIVDARAAGAEQFAPEALTAASQNLAAARSAQNGGHADRAALKARQAVADAEYARAAAERGKAEQDRAAAQAALAALPGAGR